MFSFSLDSLLSNHLISIHLAQQSFSIKQQNKHFLRLKSQKFVYKKHKIRRYGFTVEKILYLLFRHISSHF